MAAVAFDDAMEIVHRGFADNAGLFLDLERLIGDRPRSRELLASSVAFLIMHSLVPLLYPESEMHLSSHVFGNNMLSFGAFDFDLRRPLSLLISFQPDGRMRLLCVTTGAGEVTVSLPRDSLFVPDANINNLGECFNNGKVHDLAVFFATILISNGDDIAHIVMP